MSASTLKAAWVVVLGLVTAPAYAQNLVTNPDFTVDLSGWTPQGDGNWQHLAEGWPMGTSSGSARAVLTGLSLSAKLASVCVPVEPTTGYTLSFWAFIPEGQPNTGVMYVDVKMFSNAQCLGLNVSSAQSAWLSTPSADWQHSARPIVTPPAVQSVRIVLLVLKTEGAGNREAWFDAIYFGRADLSITKTDGVSAVAAGGYVVYTIVASNAGPTATSATVTDTFPASLTCAWTCVGANGSVCTPSGAGDLNDTVSLQGAASVTYTVACSVSASATGTISNTASVVGLFIDPIPANNSATDVDTVMPVAVELLQVDIE